MPTTAASAHAPAAPSASFLARRPLIARFSKNPRRIYLLTALPLLALSLAVPATAADTAVSTKLTLTAAHLIAGAIIIPLVARRLACSHA